MEEYCNNWDLEAVVRFACRLSPTPAPDPFFSYPPPPPPQQPSAAAGGVKEEETDAAWCFPDLSGHDADDLYKAFFAAPAPPPPPLQPQPQPQPPVTPRDQAPHQPPPAPQPSPRAAQPSGRQVSGAGGVPRSKRRKNQQKKVVCHVPADGVSADIWAWRKYGQKPIKGSPYPRGYYRCSSSKGCTARKQVERSRNDPNTFVITYTGDHNHPAPTHRNSLAGSTRQKFPAAPPAPLPASAPAAEAQASPPSTSAGLSPTTPLHTPSMDGEDEEEEGEEEAGALLVEDMEMVGEDELLFLKPEPASDGGGEDGAASMASLFDAVGGPDEPFFGAPWAGPTGEAAAAASGAAS